ncbi:MAG TPA: ADP-ribosylglycohydrolase family protein [Gemmatimonadales bacterium]|nr:ADP-ribosylglycohydrolase family protein [Gemmatimonadales bacterium]
MPAIADAVAGSLLGLALGDALGFVVEGAPPAAAATYATGEIRRGRAAPHGRAGYPFGQYSDDTQLARELLASFLDSGGVWHPAAFAGRIARLFQDGADVGAGPGSRGAALRVAAGIPWSEAGTPPPYAGNGAAMRAAPLGPLLADRLDELRGIVVEQSRVTHGDPRCAGGALAIAGAAAMVSTSPTVIPSELIARLAGWIEPVEPRMAEVLASLEPWLALEPVAAAGRIQGLDRSPHARSGLGFTPFVTTTVAWSLYAFLRSPDDFLESVCTAIAAGGDTDTTAAMTGAIAGARSGPSGLPAPLLDLLEDRGRWRAGDLERLARRCTVLTALREAP